MKRITSGEILKKYLGLDSQVNVNMTNSIIEIYAGAELKIEGNINLHNSSISLLENSRLLIGSDSQLRGRIIVQQDSSVFIGDRLACNGDTFIHAAEGATIFIGNDCLFANPHIYNSDLHGYYDNAYGIRLNLAKDVTIGNRVWLASNTMILKGASISENSIVGAGAIVSGEFKEGSVIIAGNPAKVIKRDISWTRKAYNSQALELLLRGTPEKFILAAKHSKNVDVIYMGMPIYTRWQEMNQSNSYLFYYLARSIFMEYFNEGDVNNKTIFNINIGLSDLLDILYMSYEKSSKSNYASGSYAYKIAKILQKNELCDELYKEIFPHWNTISRF